MNNIAQSSWRIERYWKLWWWKHRKHTPMGTKFCGQGPASLQTGGKGGSRHIEWDDTDGTDGTASCSDSPGLPRVSFNWKVLIDFDAVWSRPSRQQKAALQQLGRIWKMSKVAISEMIMKCPLIPSSPSETTASQQKCLNSRATLLLILPIPGSWKVS